MLFSLQDIETALGSDTLSEGRRLVAAFPAWLLVIRPSLAGWLPPPDADAPEVYRLLYGLQREQGEREGAPGADAIRLRRELKGLDPVLFKHYIANLGA